MVNEDRLFDLESDLVCFHCGKCCSASFVRVVTEEESRSLVSRACRKPFDCTKICLTRIFRGSDLFYLNRHDTCPFYDHGQRSCLAYDIRPDCCRKFPVRSLDHARGSIMGSVECPGFLMALSKYFDVPFQSPEV